MHTTRLTHVVFLFALLFCLFLICTGLAHAAAERTIVGSIKFPWVDAKNKAEVVLCENSGRPAAFLVDEDEPYAIQRTLRDVCGDLYDITGLVFPVVNTVPVRSDNQYMIIAGVAGTSKPLCALEAAGKIDLSSLSGKSESFQLATVTDPFPGCKGAIVIAGSDMRGAIYGLYSLTQDGLGVDPLRFWTEKPVTPRKTLFLGKMEHLEGQPFFAYRGWFTNDEDLLQGWHGTFHKIAPEIYDVILATALRLRQNMIIPATNFNVADPIDRRMLKMVKDYGMILTTHHSQCLGVWGSDWDSYWHSKGMDVEFSYVKNRDKFEQIWSDSANAYAPYMGLWQLGLRGKTDDAIWSFDKAFPKDPQGRANQILDAINLQRSIAKKASGSNEVPMTVTLWNECLDLYLDGYLKLPDDVVVIISDYHQGNMDHLDKMGLKPFPDNSAGVYYHVAYHDDHDSHLVQTVHPQRIETAMKLIKKYNLSTYFLLNVANIREFVMGIRGLADATWTGDYNAEEFYQRWCREQYGDKAAPEIEEAYKEQFALPSRFGDKEDYHLKVQGMIRYGVLILDAARRRDFSKKWAGLWGYWHQGKSLRETAEWLNGLATIDAPKWDKLCKRMDQIEKLVPASRRQFYRDNVLLQCHTACASTKWLRDSTRSALQYLDGDFSQSRQTLALARPSIDYVLQLEKKSEHDKWAGYYSYQPLTGFSWALKACDAFSKALDHSDIANRPLLARLDAFTERDYSRLAGFGQTRWGYTGSLPVEPTGCSARFAIKDPTQKPDLLVLDFDSIVKGPVKVTVNGRDIASISGERISYISIPSDLPPADELTVNLSYDKNAQVSTIVDLSVYGVAGETEKD
ncbi:MAG: glycosyl hydrolase 115 family protein [Armatimonadota bacterium]|nr:glycosyl hydrolase 115 family protein [bacterium]